MFVYLPHDWPAEVFPPGSEEPYQPYQRTGGWLKIRHLIAADIRSAAGSPVPAD